MSRIDNAKSENKRRTDSMRNGAKVIGPLDGIRSEPMTYSPHSRHSYLLDMATIAISGRGAGAGDGAPEARERMGQHLKELSIEARSNKAVGRLLTESKFGNGTTELRVNPNTTAGTGGEFVPPLCLSPNTSPTPPDEDLRQPNRELPATSWYRRDQRSEITTGSQTAIQTANAAAVSSTDIVTTTVAAPVNTIAGQEDISLQLLEQSPIAMDGVVFQDLAADYDQRLDLQVIAGSGSNGQHLGVLNVTQATSNTSILKATA